jgi:hypothetical protein
MFFRRKISAVRCIHTELISLNDIPFAASRLYIITSA